MKPGELPNWEEWQILAVRDLANGRQLAWIVVHGAAASESPAFLESRVRAHGPPLALRSDNGRAFAGEEFNAWLALVLLSTVRLPRYNGASEVNYFAVRHRRGNDWSLDGLEAALAWRYEAHCPTDCGCFAASRFSGVAERYVLNADIAARRCQLNEVICTVGEGLAVRLIATRCRRAVLQVLVDRSSCDQQEAHSSIGSRYKVRSNSVLGTCASFSLHLSANLRSCPRENGHS